jgi:hypothetical protein
MKKLRFTLRFKQGLKDVAVVVGTHLVDPSTITVNTMIETVPVIEQTLERFTGLRLHIEAEEVD